MKSKQIIKYIGGTLLAGMLSAMPIKAENDSPNELENKLENVKKEVKENPSGYSFYNTSKDTVYVKKIGDDKVKTGKNWTAIHDKEGKTNAYFYDFENDGKVDRVIFSKGNLSESQESRIESDALMSDKEDWNTMLDLNDISRDNKGNTPYNTRKVFSVGPERDKINAYNFKKGESFSAKEGAVKKMQNSYEKILDKYSKKFKK